VRKRKLIRAGHWKQLFPAVLFFMEKYLNTQQWVNRFGDNQRNSFMRRLIEQAWPVFLLSEQLRMVPGGGDLANDIIYDGQMTDGPLSSVLNHPFAGKIDDLMLSLNIAKGKVKRGPQGRILPILLDARGSICLQVEGATSKYNPRMRFYTLARATLLLEKVLGLTPEMICIVVPYLAELEKIRLSLKGGLRKIRLVDIKTATADSFQGWEARVVLWTMVSAENTGPGFVKDKERIWVSITRHTDYPITIGDSRVCRNKILEGTATLRKLFDWFKAHDRVIELGGQELS
jgi:superfamily I DNA and/or RNA helicase